MSSSFISVVMSVHDGETFLEPAIDSILQQSVRDFTFIIVDDRSTDDTPRLLEEYAKKDERIRILHNERNLGLTKSLNRALSLADSKYIARQDADDISDPKRFERMLVELERSESTVLANCFLNVIDNDGERVGEISPRYGADEMRWRLNFGNALGGHSQVMFRREPAMQAGYYDASFRYAQDFEFWQRLTRYGNCVTIPEYLHSWRSHPCGITSKNSAPQRACRDRAVAQNFEFYTGWRPNDEQAASLCAFWSHRKEEGCVTPSETWAMHQLHRKLLPRYCERSATMKLSVDWQALCLLIAGQLGSKYRRRRSANTLLNNFMLRGLRQSWMSHGRRSALKSLSA